MTPRKRPLALSLSAIVLILLSSSFLAANPAASPASAPDSDITPTAFHYLPFVAKPETCPATSPNQYQSGTAYQYDEDNPVRPAHNHADKNIELRSYVPATDPSLRKELVDVGCDDTKAPQLDTLFSPSRVPAFTELYQVYHWNWANSPNPGTRSDDLIGMPPVTALGLRTTHGERLHVPQSGYDIGGGMEVIVIFADEDTVALRYAREDSVGGPVKPYTPGGGGPGYVVHVDGICTDPNLLNLYRQLDDPNGPRYVYKPPGERPYAYPLPNLPAGHPIGTAWRDEAVVAVVDTGAFQDPRSLREYWRSQVGGEGMAVSDTYYTKQWPLTHQRLPQAWASATGEGTVIAIVDSGVDLDHLDLEDKILTDLDWDFVGDDGDADDDHGHGTHVAGIAAAATDNGLGIAGVGWDASILPLKVLDATGLGYFSDVARAISYAASNGAHVINLSVGPETDQSLLCPPFLQATIDEAHQAGLLLVAAAGNNEARVEVPPANCQHVLGVAATNRDDARPSYSSYGTHVSVAAPGGEATCSTCEVYSTSWPGDQDPSCDGRTYCYKQGTSMAVPHVSGLAALVWDRYPGYTPDQVASTILDNAVDLGAPGWDEVYGCGRVDACRSLVTGTHGTEPLCLPDMAWAADRADQGHAIPTAPFAPGEIIVALRRGTGAPSLARRYAARVEPLPTLDVWLVRVPAGRERALLPQLRADPAVLHADLNYLVTAQ